MMFTISQKRLTEKVNKDDFFNLFELTAKNMFLLLKENDPNEIFEPIVALLNSQGEVTLLTLNFENEQNKFASVNLVKSICITTNIIMIGFASEAWLKEIDYDDHITQQLTKELGVSMMPDKKECLMLNLDSIEQPIETQIIFDIIRENDVVSIVESFRQNIKGEGLLSNFLTKNFN